MPSEVTVSSFGSSLRKLSNLRELFKIDQEVKISGIGSAISAAIRLAEAFKREKSGLHQQNTFEKVPNTNKVKVSIHLSLMPLDSSHTGYQPPILESEFKERSYSDPKKSNPKSDQLAPSSSNDPSSNLRKKNNSKNGGVREDHKKTSGVRGNSKRVFYSEHEKNKENRENHFSKVPGMDKYRKVFERENVKKQDNEVFVSVGKKFGSDAKEVFKILEEEKNEEVRLKAFGAAVPKAVKLAEWVNKVKQGLEVVSHYSKKTFKQKYVPLEEGLDEVVKEKILDTVEIIVKKVKAD